LLQPVFFFETRPPLCRASCSRMSSRPLWRGRPQKLPRQLWRRVPTRRWTSPAAWPSRQWRPSHHWRRLTGRQCRRLRLCVRLRLRLRLRKPSTSQRRRRRPHDGRRLRLRARPPPPAVPVSASGAGFRRSWTAWPQPTARTARLGAHCRTPARRCGTGTRTSASWAPKLPTHAPPAAGRRGCVCTSVFVDFFDLFF
jgi:hypothetical protein